MQNNLLKENIVRKGGGVIFVTNEVINHFSNR